MIADISRHATCLDDIATDALGPIKRSSVLCQAEDPVLRDCIRATYLESLVTELSKMMRVLGYQKRNL